MNPFRLRALSPWPLACILLASVVALPVLVTAAGVFADSEGAWTHLAQTRLGLYARNTLLLALGVCVIGTIVGVSTAWLVTMCRFPGHRLFRWAMLLPLAVPTYLSAYAYTDLLQFSGPVQTGMRDAFGWSRADYWFPQIRSLGGAIFILSFSLYPYVYLAARAAFLEQSGCAIEAGRTLGRGPWRNFLTVSLPLTRPSLVAGASLLLMETVAEFGAVDYCAVDTLATGIYRTWIGLESITAAAQLASCLLGVVTLLILIELIARRRARHHHMTHRMRPLPSYQLGPSAGIGAMLACLLPVLIGFGVPCALFIRMAWRSGDARALELFADHGSKSLVLGLTAALLATILGLIIVYGRRVHPGHATLLASRCAGMGYAIPGTIIGIGLLIALTWMDHRLNAVVAHWFGPEARPGLLLSGSVVAVMLGYQARFMAVALVIIDAGLGRVRASLDDAARTLGASRLRVLTRIHLPLLRGSLFAAALLVFVDVIKELPATLILRPFNFETLAVRVYQLASDERLPEASTGALAIILIGLAPVIVLSRLIDRARAGRGNEFIAEQAAA